MGVQLVGVSGPVSPHSLSCFVILSVFILFLIMTMISALVLVSVATCLVNAKPTIYKVDEERNIAESILTPVSSTVIPLDDLPELQVGYGFGLVDKENIPKPAYLKDIKLITSANKHRFIVPGGVKQLTKEEFEAFTNQV